MTKGIVSFFEKTVKLEKVVNVLSSDYHTVYVADFKAHTIVPYRLSENMNNYDKSKYDYYEIMCKYIELMVLDEDKEEMYQECSEENIIEQLMNNEVYVHDFRTNYKNNIAYNRMKIANLSKKGQVTSAVIGFSDISQEKEKELERYAYIDNITGGDNYIRFKQRIKETTQKGYVVSMDLHYFKVVNSLCGIAKGDEVLKEVQKCIEDTLVEGDLCGHINADHYVLYLSSESKEQICAQLDEIASKIRLLTKEMEIPKVSPYYGISRWKLDKSIEIVYGEATTAKHEVKDRKDINYAFYTEMDSEKILKEKYLEDRFEDAIINNEFEIWYQPKIEPKSGKVVGAEALIRWRKKDGSLLSPGEFIPLFEKNGMIRTLDEYVFKGVCKQQKEWEQKGKEIVPISVNLSRASLYYHGIIANYKRITEEIGVDTRYIPIEITESAAVEDNNIKRAINRMKEEGFLLHIDDFGTGYSSLGTVNMLPVDTLKLDKSLIDYIGNYRGDRILHHTITLAKELGVHITAEGVENETQVEFLKNLQCDSIQGYYFAKPMNVEEFSDKLTVM